MTSTQPESKQYPQHRHPNYLGVQALSAVQDLEVLRALAVYNSRNTASSLISTPVAPTESKLVRLSLAGPSVSALRLELGMQLSTQCTDIQPYLIFRVHWAY